METEIELQNKYDALKRVHDSTNIAVESLERGNAELKRINEILTLEKSQWIQEKIMQEMIIQRALSDSNALSNKYLEEIQELKAEIRSLKG